MTPRHPLVVPSVLVPLGAAVALTTVIVLALVLEQRTPSPDANIGLGLLLIGGLPLLGLLLLWLLVRALVLRRRSRGTVNP